MTSNRMRRGRVVGGVAVVAVLAIGGAFALLLGSHHAPGRLGLSSPAASRPASSLTGEWKVGSGSEAGYRVREQFINQPGPTEAVARTSKISGGLRVQASGSTLQASGVHFTADLAALQSQDKYANYQVYQRDFFIRTIYLQTDQFPKADFTASPVSIPPGIESGPVSITVSGRLTVHGVTKSVMTILQAQGTANGIEIAGSINTDMRDFGVDVPSISFTQAEPGVVIEYHLVLVHA